MNSMENQKNDYGYIKPDEAVEVSFRDIGHAPDSYGHWTHQNSIALFDMFPRAMTARMSRDGVNKYHKDLLEAEEKKKL